MKLYEMQISLARCRGLAEVWQGGVDACNPARGIVIHVIASAPAMAQDRAAIEAGESVYDEHCANCHGAKLRPTGAMPDLKQQKAEGRARFDQIVMSGKNQMPAWQGVVSPARLTRFGPTFDRARD